MKCVRDNPQEVLKHGKCRKLRFSCIEALPVSSYNEQVNRKRKLEFEIEATVHEDNDHDRKALDMSNNHNKYKSIQKSSSTNSLEGNKVEERNPKKQKEVVEEEDEEKEEEDEEEEDDEYESMQQNQLSMLKFIQ